MSEIEQWAGILKVLGHPVRLLIVLGLYASNIIRKDAHSLTFSELLEFTGIPKDESLVYHLKQLEAAGFISKDPYKDEKGRVYAIYHVSEQGTNILKDTGLLRLFEPKLKRIAGAA